MKKRYTDRDNNSATMSLGFEDSRRFSNMSYIEANKSHQEGYEFYNGLNNHGPRNQLNPFPNQNPQACPVFVPGMGYVMPIQIGASNMPVMNYGVPMNLPMGEMVG